MKSLPWILIFMLLWVDPTGAAMRDANNERSHVFRSLSSAEGLVQNTINSLHQDRRGFVWVGTQGGLHRYDGFRFQVFQHDPTRSNSLPDALISSIAETNNGDLWLGTDGAGVVRIDPDSGDVLERLQLPHSNRVSAMLAMPDTALWIATHQELLRYSPPDGGVQIMHRFEVDDIPSALAADRRNVLWVGSGSGLKYYENGKLTPHQSELVLGQISALKTDLADRLLIASSEGLFELSKGRSKLRRFELAPSQVTDLALANDGTIWLASASSGLLRLDFAGNVLDRLTANRNLPGSLPDNSLQKLLMDKSAQLWIGTRTHGLALTQSDPAPFSLIRPEHNGSDNAEAYNVRAVCTQQQLKNRDRALPGGRLFFGTTLGTLQSLDQEGLKDWSPLLLGKMGAELGEVRINALGCESVGDVYVATSNGVWIISGDDPASAKVQSLEVAGYPNLHVRSLLQLRDGGILLGTHQNGLVHLDATRKLVGTITPATHGLPSSLVLALFEDRSGNVWVGTLDGVALKTGGLSSTQPWRVLRSDNNKPRTLPGNIVRHFLETRSGQVWIATHSGLARVDEIGASEVSFSRFTTRDGLPTPTVYALQEDKLGRIWLSSNRGLVSYDPEKLKWRSFELSDGLQDLEFNGGATAQFGDGRLVFAGVGGLNTFRPELIQPSDFLVPVQLLSARAGRDGAMLAPKSSYEFAFDDRVYIFEFAALDFRQPVRNGYAFKLDGFDKNWITGRGLGRAVYTNLPEGNYRFRIRGSNRDDFWNPSEVEVKVKIKPPWMRTPLAYLSYFLLATAAIAITMHFMRRNRLREKQYFRDIAEREDRLRLSLWGSRDFFWDYDVLTRRLRRNSTEFVLNANLDGDFPADEYLAEQVHPDESKGMRNAIIDVISGRDQEFNFEHRLANGGGWTWVYARGRVVDRDANGKPVRIAGTARNIETDRAAQRQIAISARVIERMSEAVAVSDENGLCLKVNSAFEQMTGFMQSEIVGKRLDLLRSPRHDASQYNAVQELLTKEGRWKGELWQRRKDGADILVSMELNLIAENSGDAPIQVSVMSDITDRKRAEEELRFLANFDSLTGLPNRTMLLQRLSRAIARARRHKQRVALLFVDLDRFKHINDSLGHAAGDVLLQGVGERMMQAVREIDTVARLAGDEFVLLVEELEEMADATRAAERVLERFIDPFNLGGTDVVVSPSIGISVFPDHSEQPDELLKFADLAMYAAKSAGRNTVRSYHEDQSQAAKERAATENLLRRALDRDQFEVYYQVAVDLKTLRPVGVEALIRWRHPSRGLTNPDAFVPILEENGMIVSVGNWVLREALAQLKAWDLAGLPPLGMSVNLSIVQLTRGDLFSELPQMLEHYHLPGSRLTLELTESLVMANPEQSIETLNRLSSLGVSIAVDDFGTGYSSLAYLKRLPIDKLKIDKTFVRDLGTDPEDTAITHSIIALAQALDISVIAEGVENETQQSLLRALGCQEAQGFLYAKPLSAGACTVQLRTMLGLTKDPSLT